MRTVFIQILFLLALPVLSSAQPAVSFEIPSHDFGTVSQDDKISHHFVFENTGSEELVIEGIKPS